MMDQYELSKDELIEKINELEMLNKQLLDENNKRIDWNTLGVAIWGIGIGTLRLTTLPLIH